MTDVTVDHFIIILDRGNRLTIIFTTSHISVVVLNVAVETAVFYFCLPL